MSDLLLGVLGISLIIGLTTFGICFIYSLGEALSEIAIDTILERREKHEGKL